MWTAITAIIGLVSTVLAWFFNPARRNMAELNNIFKELDSLYIERDRALEKNDYNTLTRVIARINVLRERKNSLFQ